MLDFTRVMFPVLQCLFEVDGWDTYPFNMLQGAPKRDDRSFLQYENHKKKFLDLEVTFSFPVMVIPPHQRVFCGSPMKPNAVSLTRDGYIGIEGLFDYAPPGLFENNNQKGISHLSFILHYFFP